MGCWSKYSHGVHFCDSVNSLLPSLYELRCRMASVCESLLKPPKDGKPLQLVEVIGNLRCMTSGPLSMGIHTPERCGQLGGDHMDVNEAMQEAASELVSSMSNPEMVRILRFEYPPYRIYAFDAITGQHLRQRSVRWDADGTPMEEDDGGDEAGDDNWDVVLNGSDLELGASGKEAGFDDWDDESELSRGGGSPCQSQGLKPRLGLKSFSLNVIWFV